MLKIKRYCQEIQSLALILFLVSCSSSEELPTPDLPAGMVEVRVAVSSEASRTEIEENGMVTRWSPEDKIALWATNGSTMALSAQTFSLYYFAEEYPTAYFTAVINPMAEGDYTYYGAYPLPVAVNGTEAQFDLPATQDGSTTVLKNALMVGRSQRGAALTSAAAEELHMDFVHKLHILKITIPETKNLLGESIHRIELTFPVPVVGRLTTDVSNVDAAVTLSEASNVLNLEFAEPVEAGDVVYAVIAPVDASSGEITFRGYSELRESESIATPGKNFQPGHTTPIRLTIPQLRKITRLYFSLGENFLGENPNTFTVTVNNGTFPDGTTTKSFTVNAENRYEVSYEGEFTDNFSGKTLTYTFDSEHAVVSDTSEAMPTIEAYSRNTMPAQDIPYLFFEDFSTVTTFAHDYTAGPHTSVNAASSTGYDLSQHGIPSGWTGARTAGEAGTAILVAGRVDEVKVFGIGGATRAYGRLDSPAMGALKAGAKVNVSVRFNYNGGCRDDDKDKAYTSIAAFGYTTTSGTIKGYATQYVDEPQFSNISEHTEFSDIEKTGSWDSITKEKHYTISGCANNYRLSWHMSVMGGNGINNACHWIYLDNIRVSIAQ